MSPIAGRPRAPILGCIPEPGVSVMSSDQHPLDPARDRWFLGTLMRFHATKAETGGAVSVVEQRAPAGFSPPLHVHANEDAVLVVLEGALTVQVGDVRRRLLPSESVFLPRRDRKSTRLNSSH